MKIAKLHLLSKADHYVDITIELLKAEIALNSNLNYEQDKPIKLSEVVIK
jgi:dihydropteroate synthase